MNKDKLIISFFINKENIKDNECEKVKKIVNKNIISGSEYLFDNIFRSEYSITYKINSEEVINSNEDYEKLKKILSKIQNVSNDSYVIFYNINDQTSIKIWKDSQGNFYIKNL